MLRPVWSNCRRRKRPAGNPAYTKRYTPRPPHDGRRTRPNQTPPRPHRLRFQVIIAMLRTAVDRRSATLLATVSDDAEQRFRAEAWALTPTRPHRDAFQGRAYVSANPRVCWVETLSPQGFHLRSAGRRVLIGRAVPAPSQSLSPCCEATSAASGGSCPADIHS